MLIIVENVQKMHITKAKLITINNKCNKLLKNVEKCVTMLKNVNCWKY